MDPIFITSLCHNITYCYLPIVVKQIYNNVSFIFQVTVCYAACMCVVLVSGQLFGGNFNGFGYNAISGDFGGPSAFGSGPSNVRDPRENRGKAPYKVYALALWGAYIEYIVSQSACIRSSRHWEHITYCDRNMRTLCLYIAQSLYDISIHTSI